MNNLAGVFFFLVSLVDNIYDWKVALFNKVIW